MSSPESLPQHTPVPSAETTPPGFDEWAALASDAPVFSEATPHTEVLAVTPEESTTALSGLSRWVHERRLGKAERTIERMDHKDDLYEGMAYSVLGRGTAPKPRTRVERFMDKRLEKAAFKHSVRNAKRKFVTDAYGGEASSTVNNRSRLSTFKESRKLEAGYASGDLTAHQLRQEKQKLKARPRKFANAEQRHSRRVQLASEANLIHMAQQKRLFKWREGRRNRAIKRAAASREKLGLSD